MKFKLVLEGTGPNLYLEPENPVEEQILGAAVGGYKPHTLGDEDDSKKASITATWSHGQLAYKRCLGLKIEF